MAPALEAAPRLISPNGGERLLSGEVFTVLWEAPAGAAMHQLHLTVDSGRTWKLIAAGVTGEAYRWAVPARTSNPGACRVRVTSFTAAGATLGRDASDRPFAIDVVRVNSPGDGATLHSRRPFVVSWTQGATVRPVARARLLWSADGGGTWSPLGAARPPARSLLATLPAVASAKGRCRVKVVLEDSAGKPVGSDASTGFFTLRPAAAGLVLREWRQRYYNSDWLWASVSLFAGSGRRVTGLKQGDFQLTEKLYGPAGNLIATAPVVLDTPWAQFNGPGFWERSASLEKLDVVFIVDMSGSMSSSVPGLQAELHAFLDRLKARHTDFRIGLVRSESVTAVGPPQLEPFRGVSEEAEIRTWIDGLDTGGEGWDPSFLWDALLYATGNFRFREDARRLVVIVADTIPGNVYGTDWYPNDCTAATLSAAARAVRDSGVEVLYSRWINPAHTFGEYTDPRINPRAGDGESGLEALRAAALATDIGWPFDQAAIPLPAPQPVADARYYFAWATDLPSCAGCRAEVTVRAPHPDQPGKHLRATFSYPSLRAPVAGLTLTVLDEKGRAGVETDVFLDTCMAERCESPYRQLDPQPGPIALAGVPLGPYRIRVDNGAPFQYQTLDHALERWLSVPAAGAQLRFVLEVGDRAMELTKARGLLDDLAAWGLVGTPFGPTAREAAAWIDRIDSRGIDWQDMERVKRLYVALSGYANASAYAEEESRRIAKDFVELVTRVQRLVEEVTDVKEQADDTFYAAVAEAAVRGDLVTGALLSGQEATLIALKEYVLNDLVPYLFDQIKQKIDDPEIRALLDVLVDNLILGDWGDIDWENVLAITSAIALDEAADQLVTLLSDTLIARIVGDGDAERLLRGMLTALATDGFDGMKSHLEGVKGTLLARLQADPAGARARVKAIFAQLAAVDGVPGGVRDFLLPLAEVIAVAAVEGGELDKTAVVEGLSYFFCSKIVLEPYYVQPVKGQLAQLLAGVQAFAPGPGGWQTRASAMASTFFDIRWDVMTPLQESCWWALGDHVPIDDMLTVLSGLFDMLETLGGLFQTVCALGYPMTCNVLDDLDAIGEVLDGIGLMTKVYDLWVRADDLTGLAGKLAPLPGLAVAQ